MTDSFVFANTPADFNYFNGIFAALDALFPVIGNTTSNSKWSGFKGKVVVASYSGNSSPVKAPASSTANTTTPSTSKTAAKRLQAVQTAAKATIVIDATAGVDLKKITSTGLTQVSKGTFSGNNQTDLSGNLIKALSLLTIMFNIFFY